MFKHSPSVEWVKGSVILINGTHWKNTMNLSIDYYISKRACRRGPMRRCVSRGGNLGIFRRTHTIVINTDALMPMPRNTNFRNVRSGDKRK